MEILDNSQHLKSLKDNCSQLSHAMASTFDQRQEEDIDIEFQLKCKKELSKEVIKWKEESLSLKIANELKSQKLDELHLLLKKLTERNAFLETRLLAADEENEKLKLHSLAIDNENSLLFKKLTHGMNMYHSFPWANSSPNDKVQTTFEFSSSEDWKVVSQKLFEQMKQEMKELQNMSNCLSFNEEKCDDILKCPPDFQKVEDHVSTLAKKTDTLKKDLLKQRNKLKLMISCIDKGSGSIANENSIADITDRKASSTKYEFDNQLVCDFKKESKGNTKNATSRPSDDSFRDYFMRQLQGKRSENMTPTALMQLYMESKKKGLEDSTKIVSGFKKENSSSVLLQSGSEIPLATEVPTRQNCTQKIITSTTDPLPDEDRVCPICEAVFPKIVPYENFEAHVVEHLEVESASLLDQYVVL